MIVDIGGSPLRKLILFATYLISIFLIVGIARLIGFTGEQIHDHIGPIILGAAGLVIIEQMVVGYVKRDPTGVRAWTSVWDWVVLTVIISGTAWLAWTG